MLGLGLLKRVTGEVRRDLAAARERDPAARGVGSIEILSSWGGVQAILVHRVAHALHEAGLPAVPMALAYASRAVTGVEIHPAARIGAEPFIDHGSGVVIGEAVEHGDGPLLVLAGAGSGKTRVLTHRIAHLLASDRARPSEILAITFTNKAAGEMRERVAALVGGVSRVMWVMTFHSACARILRANADRLGYRRAFTIYDEADSLRMIRRCLDELEIDPKRFPPRAVRAQISRSKNTLIDPEAYREAQGGFFERTVADVFHLYERRMREANAMDFDDLLARTVDLLELFEDVRERYRRAFRHVLVDEYQDTNRVQYRLLQLLCEEHRNLCVVGDDCQSIYSFRHADIRNILDFEADFPDSAVVMLEQNYRSTQTILSATNAIVAHNRERLGQRPWTEAGGGAPG